MSSKQTIRKRQLAARDAMPAALRAENSRSVTATAVSRAGDAERFAVYSALGSELDPADLVQQLRILDKTLAFPRVSRTSGVLEFCLVEGVHELAPGNFGILEPAASCPPVALSTIQVFFIPGLSFDSLGNRIGWGKGYYDQTLAQCPAALRIGLCFQQQIEPSIPCVPFDQTMDCVITESRLYEVPNRPRSKTSSGLGSKE